MKTNLMGLYKETLNNCQLYDESNDVANLLLEINALIGIANILKFLGYHISTDELIYFNAKKAELLRQK